MKSDSKFNQENNIEDIDIKDILNSFKRRKKIILASAFSIFLITCFYTVYQRFFKPTFIGNFTLLINDPLSSNNEGSGEASQLFTKLARNTTQNDLPTLIELLKSPNLIVPISEKYSIPYYEFRRNLTIKTPGEGVFEKAKGILNISVIDQKPKRLNSILKSLEESYLQVALQQRQQRISDGLDFLNKQAPILQQKTDYLQQELSEFRKKYKLLEPSLEGSVLKEKLSKLNTKISVIQSYRNRLLNIKETINQGKISALGFVQALESGDQSESFGIKDADQAMIDQLLKVKTELAKARSKYKSSSPMVKGLEMRLNALEPLLKKSQMDSVDTALILSKGSLKIALDQRDELLEKFSNQPELIKKYNNIKQRLEISQENLAGLVSARESYQLQIAQRSVPWKVIASPYVNPIPVRPSIPKNLFMGLLISAASGIFIGLFKDKLDPVFHSESEVKDELNLPVLGNIPFLEFLGEKSFDDNSLDKLLDEFETDNDNAISAFHLRESLRNISTSIRFLDFKRKKAFFVLTSSIPGEGKSLSSFLLAKTLSEIGVKVLLVDSDMRKPQLHIRLGLDNIRGLSNYLIGDCQLDDIFQDLDNCPNLKIITAGTKPPNPINLLSSDKLKEFFDLLENTEKADFILIDSPPAIGLSDSALLSKYSDGVLFMVSISKVDRNLPKEAYRLIRSRGSEVVGIITNQVIKTKSLKNSAQANTYAEYLPDKNELPERKKNNLDKPSNFIKDIYNNFVDWIND